MVRNDSRPVRILAGLLARILEWRQAGEFDFTRLSEAGPEHTPGEMVRLRKGALAGFAAEVSSMLSKGRVEVLINFMGNITRAKMQACELRRLEAAE